MKTLILGALLGLAVALGGQAEAQPVERVAFTYCDDYSYWGLWCAIVVMDADGSNAEIVGGGMDPAWSPDGSRLMFHWNGVFVLDLASRTTVTLPAAGWSPALSPDGSNVVVGVEDLWVTKADGTGAPVNLTNHAALYRSPAWSPDGARIAFGADRGDVSRGCCWWGDLFVMNADGSGLRRLTYTESVAFHERIAWSPDGRRITFTCFIDTWQTCQIDADGAGPARPLGPPGGGTAWSPDGTSIAFVTGAELAVMNPDGSGVRPLTVGANAGEPAWSSDGRRIVFAGSSCDGAYGYGGLWIVSADDTGRACFGGAPTYPGPLWAAAWMPGTVERASSSPVITHTPITLADANADIVVTATITDDVAVTEAALTYGTLSYGFAISAVMQPLTPDSASYTATIPASAVTTDGLWYSLEARDADGNVTQTPMVAGMWPYRIAVLASRPTLSVSPNTGPPGTEFTVTLTNWGGGDYDWLAVAPAGATNTTYDWAYVSWLSGAGDTRTWRVTLSTPGTFEARFFPSDGFIRAGTSPPFIVDN